MVNRSYLALVAGVVSEADYVFIPESPPPNDWAHKLCDKLTQASLLRLIFSRRQNKKPIVPNLDSFS